MCHCMSSLSLTLCVSVLLRVFMCHCVSCVTLCVSIYCSICSLCYSVRLGITVNVPLCYLYVSALLSMAMCHCMSSVSLYAPLCYSVCPQVTLYIPCATLYMYYVRVTLKVPLCHFYVSALLCMSMCHCMPHRDFMRQCVSCHSVCPPVFRCCSAVSVNVIFLSMPL